MFRAIASATTKKGQGKHMLDAYIIDAIRQEEEQRRQHDDAGRRIHLDLPLPLPPRAEKQEIQLDPDFEADVDRGPIVIPLYPNEDASEDAA